MAQQYDREKLYEQVWQTPMRALAKQYGLSDQGLRKVCIKLQIPLPVAGHWAKVAVGKAIQIPELLPLQDSPPPRPPARKRKSNATNADSRSGSVLVPRPDLSSVEQYLRPLESDRKLHPAIKPLVPVLNDALAQAKEFKKRHDREDKGEVFNGPRWDALHGNWKQFVEDGYCVKVTHRKFVMNGSIFQYRRALSILSSICERLEQAGFAASMKADCARLAFEMGGEEVEFRISEKFEIHDRKGKDWRGTGVVKYKVPTGLFRVHIDDWGSEHLVSESRSEPMDLRIDLILKAIQRRHQSQKEQKAKWAADRRADEVKREELAAVEARLAEERRRLEAEKSKRDALVLEAQEWERAESVRRYVKHLDDRLASEGKEPHAEYVEWREWALLSASVIDKSETRIRPTDPVDQSIEASIARLAAVGIYVNKPKHSL